MIKKIRDIYGIRISIFTLFLTGILLTPVLTMANTLYIERASIGATDFGGFADGPHGNFRYYVVGIHDKIDSQLLSYDINKDSGNACFNHSQIGITLPGPYDDEWENNTSQSIRYIPSHQLFHSDQVALWPEGYSHLRIEVYESDETIFNSSDRVAVFHVYKDDFSENKSVTYSSMGYSNMKITLSLKAGSKFADIDGDGAMDLVTESGDADYYVTFYDSRGTQLLQDHGSTNKYHQWDLADIDGDGAADLVVANSFNDYYVTFWKNTNNGTNATTSIKMQDHDGYIADHEWRLADMDGDGAADLVVANPNNDYFVTFWKNTNNGANATTSIKMQDHGNYLANHNWKIADIDGDGASDLIVANPYNDYYVTFWKNTGNGANPVSSIKMQDHGGTLSGHQWKLADMDGDGASDLIVANPDNNYYITFWKNTNNGTNATTSIKMQDHGGILSDHQWKIADVDGDGASDLVVVNYLNEFYVTLWKNTGNGSNPGTAILMQDHQGSIFGGHAWNLADVDGDGAVDLVYAYTLNDYHVTFWKNRNTDYKMQDHGGFLTDHVWELADINGDGASDLVIMNISSDDYYATFWNNTGNGSNPQSHEFWCKVVK
ncbi:MAG: VCBS repeat-containing protein [bacterium]|nr:VCBS repeat-containing protein [bacterium]